MSTIRKRGRIGSLVLKAYVAFWLLGIVVCAIMSTIYKDDSVKSNSWALPGFAIFASQFVASFVYRIAYPRTAQ
jgi:hypothetical protein